MAYSHSTYVAGILGESARIKELLVRTRNIIAESRELLAEPAPSTFLGKMSFVPFVHDDHEFRPLAESADV